MDLPLIPIREILDVDDTGIPSLEEISKMPESRNMYSGFDTDNPKGFAHRIVHVREYRQEAINWFKNQVMIDLGAGWNINGYRLACIAGTRGYVAVEKSHARDLFNNMTSEEYWTKSNPQFDHTPGLVDAEKVRCCIVNLDMKDFLSRLPYNSVCVLASGIDRCIMPRDEDRSLIEEQIVRVLSDDGAFIDLCSGFEPDLTLTQFYDDFEKLKTFRRRE